MFGILFIKEQKKSSFGSKNIKYVLCSKKKREQISFEFINTDSFFIKHLKLQSTNMLILLEKNIVLYEY